MLRISSNRNTIRLLFSGPLILALGCALWLVTGNKKTLNPPEDLVLPSPFQTQTSIETYPVMIKVKNHVLKIPRNYLETAAPTADQVFFRVVTTFPDFLGVNENTAAQFRSLTSVAGWWNSGPPNIIWANNVTFVASAQNSWIDPTIKIASGAQNTTVEYGLTKLSGQIMGGNYYVSLGFPAGEMVVIKCGKDRTCMVRFDLSSDLVIAYGYGEKMLPHWKEVDSHLKRLLVSFLEN